MPESGASEDVEQVELDAIGAGSADVSGGSRHGRQIFPRQPQDLMDHHSDPPGLQCLHCLVEHCQLIAPPDPGGAFRVDGL